MKKERLDQGILQRLLGAWNSATPAQRAYGMDWYRLAGEIATELGTKYGFGASTAIGVLASLSPGSNWERNLSDLETALRYGAEGRALPRSLGTYGERNREKATRILKGEPPLEVLGGNKVTSFYRNLMGIQDGAVTIDRHAKGAALGVRGEKETTVKSSREYKALAEHYRELARRLGVEPRHFQAVVWTVWRDGKPNGRGTGRGL